MIYSVRHVTTFQYKPAVRESVMEIRMQPRNEGAQRCLSFSLEVDPTANIMSYRDALGNIVHHFDIAGSHTRVKVSAQALVDLQEAPAAAPASCGDWQDLNALMATEDHWEMLLPSEFAQPTSELERLAAEFRLERKGNPFELVVALTESIYNAFEYVPNSTKVDSPIDDALRSRQGVCQDFAHIMIALLRQLNIPARYVSGYLAHVTSHKDRSIETASHAWVEALMPRLGWVSVDPTNNLVGGDRHIRVAIGRDYADVPPNRGVYKGEAESQLSVAVLVAPANAPLGEELPPTVILRPNVQRQAAKFRAPQDHSQQQQ